MALVQLVQKEYASRAPVDDCLTGLGLVDFGYGRRAATYDLQVSHFHRNGAYEGMIEGASDMLEGLSGVGTAQLQTSDGACYRLSVKSYDPVFEFCFVVARPL